MKSYSRRLKIGIEGENKRAEVNKENFNKDHLELNNLDNNLFNHTDLKNSYIKLNMLLVYYEKIIFDFMNRVMVDISKQKKLYLN